MLRKGRFAIVGGKEYGLVSCRRQYYLQSTNRFDLANGFATRDGKRGVFVKKVTIAELEDAYEIFPYVMLSSHRFAVEGVNQRKGTVILVTSNPFVKNKLNVKPYGIDEYVIELPIDEVTVKEEKITILGFERNNSLFHELI